MENEILQQILSEIKSVRDSQAVLERDMREIRNQQSLLSIQQDKLDRGQARLESDGRAVKEQSQLTYESVLRLELVEVPKIQAALDGFASNYEKLQEHDDRIIDLETVAEKHDTDIARLKAAK